MPLAVRRPLFLHGGLQMLACYVTLAALLGIEFRKCAVHLFKFSDFQHKSSKHFQITKRIEHLLL